MRRSAALGAVISLVMLPTAATAAWSAAGTGGATVAAPAMTNAGSLAATCGAKKNGVFPVTLTWTASQHPAVAGYEISRTGGSGPVSIQVAGRTTATATDSLPQAASGNTTVTYSYTIRAKSANLWTTPASAPVAKRVTTDSCT